MFALLAAALARHADPIVCIVLRPGFRPTGQPFEPHRLAAQQGLAVDLRRRLMAARGRLPASPLR